MLNNLHHNNNFAYGKPRYGIRAFCIATCFALTLAALAGCESNKNKAIDLVKNSRFVSKDDTPYGIPVGAQSLTCQDFANKIAESSPHDRWSWADSAVGTLFLVRFRDTAGWGPAWEVNLRAGVVKYVYDNEFLFRKYGFTHVDWRSPYCVVIDTLIGPVIRERPITMFGVRVGSENPKVDFFLRGSATNNTDKVLTSAALSGWLELVFADSLVSTDDNDILPNWLQRNVSERSPWLPGQKLEFRAWVTGVDPIYLNYDPPYADIAVQLTTKDPTGYSYGGISEVLQVDLKKRWKRSENPGQ